MDHAPLVFSIVFFLLAAVYLILGGFVLVDDSRDSQKRLFFLICCALSVWSFGFSVSIVAATEAACIAWRRVSAVGWGSLYALFLHFVLVLTGEKGLLRRRRLLVLMYLPAVITVYVFSFSTEMSCALYRFIETPLGWVNDSPNGAWDQFFNLYYLSYSMAVMGLLIKWRMNTDDPDERKQAASILFSYFAAILLGSLTDIVSNTYWDVGIPQVAPVIILIPIAAMYHSMRRHGLLDIKPIDRNEEILSPASKDLWIHFLSFVLCMGAALNFLVRFHFMGSGVLESFAFSALLLLAAFILEVMRRTGLSENAKDAVVLAVSCVCVAALAWEFRFQGGVTLWAAPFALVVGFIAFNRREMLFVLGGVILAFQGVVWALAPSMTVGIDSADHLVRMALTLLILGFALYINKLYILKLNENAERMERQKMIAEISKAFASVGAANLDAKVDGMLRVCGEALQVCRVYLFLYDKRAGTMTNTHEWCREGILAEKENLANLPLDIFPWWMAALETEGLVHIGDLEALPEAAEKEKAVLESQGIQSLIAVPVMEGGKAKGFLGFDSVYRKKVWEESHIETLRICAKLLSDALNRVEMEKEREILAYYDQLTGLPNRTLFNELAGKALAQAGRTGGALGMLFLDLDSFKMVNDTLGHAAGDACLRTLAEEIGSKTRRADIVARFGGDEFLVLLTGISGKADIQRAAEKIMSIFPKPFRVKGHEFFLTASMGVAAYPVDGEDVESLVRNADIAMYDAKQRGKNRLTWCSPDMKDEIERIMALTNRLFRAMERKELSVRYQPFIDLRTGAVTGMEALVRWENDEFGAVPPSVFIPLAERSGLINPMGEWVLRQACADAMTWRDDWPENFRMAVNLSVVQIARVGLVDRFRGILADVGFPPEHLEFEITESLMVHDGGFCGRVLEEIKGMGVSVSIDDFGTRYSSLSRLKRLPIDRLKMDIQFTRGILEDDKGKAIAEAIVMLSKSLGVRTVAEGVETGEQLEFLKRVGCEEVQGYYYARPMPAKEMGAFLRERNLLFSPKGGINKATGF